MPSTLTTNLLRRTLTSGSTSRSGNVSPGVRHGSQEFYVVKRDDSSFASTRCDTPPDCDSELFLRRMPRNRSADHGLHYDSSESLLVRTLSSDSGLVSPSESVTSFDSSYSTFSHSDIRYDRIVDKLLARTPNPFLSTGPRNLLMFDPAEDDYLKNDSVPPLMIKRLKMSSHEAALLQSINQPILRLDPWNASPHILAAVERGEYVYLCMKQLAEYDDPPLLTVEHYIDFFRQVLERLTFLHEYGICGLSLAQPSSYMMDTSSGPSPADATSQASSAEFDRSRYPVHYYFVNFTKATRIPKQPLYPSSTPSSPRLEVLLCPFQRDVRDCGTMFESLLIDVPQISEKFRPLIEHMKMGHYTHKFFEELRNTVEHHIFQSPAANVLSIPEAEEIDGGFSSPTATVRPWQQTFSPLDRSLSH